MVEQIGGGVAGSCGGVERRPRGRPAQRGGAGAERPVHRSGAAGLGGGVERGQQGGRRVAGGGVEQSVLRTRVEAWSEIFFSRLLLFLLGTVGALK